MPCFATIFKSFFNAQLTDQTHSEFGMNDTHGPSHASYRSAPEWWVMLVWSVLCLTVNVLGNSTVLVVLRNAPETLERVTKFILQGIAVCDIGYGVSAIAPMIISLIAEDWVLGYHLCFATAVLRLPVFVATVILVLALSVNKVVVLLRPFYVRSRSVRLTCLCIALATGVSFSAMLLCYLLPRPGHAVYIAHLHACMVFARAHFHLNVFRALALPCMLGVVLSVIALIFIAQRQTRLRIKRQATLAAIFVAGTYTVLYLPTLYPVLGGRLSNLFHQVAIAMSFLNSCHNIFIYYATLRSFREFLLGLFRTPRDASGALGTSSSAARVSQSALRSGQKSAAAAK